MRPRASFELDAGCLTRLLAADMPFPVFAAMPVTTHLQLMAVTSFSEVPGAYAPVLRVTRARYVRGKLLRRIMVSPVVYCTHLT